MAIRHNKAMKIFSATMLGCNLTSCILGIAYIVSSAYIPLWDILGGLLIITFLGNSFLLYVLDRTIEKNSTLGRKLNLWSYGSLVVIVLAMGGLLLGNLLVSMTYADLLPSMWWGYAIIFLSYFSLVGMGMRIALLSLKYYRIGAPVQDNSEGTLRLSVLFKDRHWKLRALANGFSVILLFCGVYFSIITLFGGEVMIIFDPITGGLSSLVSMGVAGFGLFWAFVMLGTGLLMIKNTRRYKSKKIARIVGIITLIVGGILLLPAAATSVVDVPLAETHFSEAFGADWRARIPTNVESFFLPTRFVAPGYFLGIPPKNCIIKRDILFYNGTTGPAVDAEISLYFDAYLPPNNGLGLPGANSTLIRIHGGGWISGDKGAGNMLQMKEYFAAQGYCVFDIQYGLNQLIPTYLPILDFLTPSHVVGNFTIYDMVRHIGIFCQYLTSHSTEYGANLSSVFISGGSAGGHLTCATALAIASENYTSLFGDGIDIKSYIPFYPGNRHTSTDTTTPKELLNPSLLINASSPPCLIFQGLEDSLVYPIYTEEFQETYVLSGNTKCAVIWLSGAGHLADLYFPGYYNQLFLYYMERFLYLYR